ncbi:TolC family protein [Flavobacterium psychrophilum]|uniref:TolC family protein n=1 Tax=Flavobacterium psychrophilum TaxID=96345 RepID=UPI001D074CB3|nr:TolC family protein [Flavobacterium psychrophilum]MCB6129754.1 TolC family protein [Flavobacterium psychrophilum]MCB6204004.1 TolC family protein [Flavobacterium psychrophilum]MCB6227170.1 TolC family protein [Flavobacterium psychrophilum]
MQKIKYSFLIITTLLYCGVSFGQPKKWTLEECVAYAIEHNISIKQAALDKELSDISKKDALGKFFPSVNAQSSHSWNIGLTQNITTGLLENQTTQFTSAGVNISIDIYKGLQNQNLLRKANLSSIASQYQLTKMQEDVSLNIVNGYLQILFNKENLKVQQLQLAYDNKQLERSKELVEAGVTPRGDLLDVKATVATDNQRFIAAENALFLSKLSLAQLLQIDDFENFDITDAEIPIQENTILMQDPKVILDKAKKTRTDLKIAQTNVQIAEKNLQISRGAYQPTLQGFYSFSTRAGYSDRVVGFAPNTSNPTAIIGYVEGTNQSVLQPNYSRILDKPDAIFNQFSTNKGQNFGLNLNIPILNGFSVRNNVARSKIALDRSKITLKQQELDVERTVFTAYTDTKGAQKTHEAALATFEARQKSFNYAKERYEVGLMNIFDFNQAQTLFTNAQSEVLRTKYDYIFRTKILEFYFGIPIIKKQ